MSSTDQAFFLELQRARRHQAIARGITGIMGAVCALIILAVVGAITLEIIDQEVGPYGTQASISDDE